MIGLQEWVTELWANHMSPKCHVTNDTQEWFSSITDTDERSTVIWWIITDFCMITECEFAQKCCSLSLISTWFMSETTYSILISVVSLSVIIFSAHITPLSRPAPLKAANFDLCCCVSGLACLPRLFSRSGGQEHPIETWITWAPQNNQRSSKTLIYCREQSYITPSNTAAVSLLTLQNLTYQITVRKTSNLFSSKSAYYYDFWRSCDTEDCSNDAENTAAHHRNKLQLAYIHIENTFIKL